jgi:hypothetical protein
MKTLNQKEEEKKNLKEREKSEQKKEQNKKELQKEEAEKVNEYPILLLQRILLNPRIITILHNIYLKSCE